MKPLIRQRLVELFAKKIEPRRGLVDIRDNSNIAELSDAIAEIEKKSPDLLANLVKATKLLAYSHLHDSKLPVGNLKGELNLLTVSLRRSIETVRIFVQERVIFDRYLIQGNYGEARTQLSNIIASCGISCWTLEQELLLAQLNGGLEANKAFLSSLQDQCDNPITLIIARMISSRIETNVSWDTFRDEAIAFKQRNKRNANIVCYILAKVNFIDDISDPQIQDILHWSNSASCCDAYNTLLALARLAKAKTLKCAQSVKDACSRIGELIEDPILHHLIEAYNPNVPPLLTKEASALVKIYDLALLEKWAEVKVETEYLIKDCPTVFEFYEWNAIASSILCPAASANIASGPISTVLLTALTQIECQSHHIDLALVALKKASMLLGHRAIGYKIDAYWRRYKEGDRKSDTFRLATIACNASTPSVALSFSSRVESQTFVRKWIDAFPDSPYLRVMESFYLPDTADSNSALALSKSTQAVIQIQRLIFSGRLNEAAEQAESFLTLNGDDSLVRPNVYDNDLFQKIVLTLFSSGRDYVALRMLTRALLSKRITFGQLLHPLKAHLSEPRSSRAMRSIYSPLYQAISGALITDIHIAYANFCELHSLNKPTDLFESTLFTKQELIWFWHRVCVYEVLERSEAFDDAESAERERINILKELQVQDQQSAKVYSEEQVKLTQRLLLRKGLNKIDTSKINIGREGLIETNGGKWREQFSRYLEFHTFKRLMPLLAARLSANQLDLDSVAPDLRSHFSQLKEVLFVYFRELFFEMRREFLHNKLYGLNASLSTRIRHGILVRQVRSIFEEKRLVFTTGHSNSISALQKSINTEWPELGCSEGLASAFATFSDRVNALALNLRDTKIQIEEGQETSLRLFNYYFTDIQLYQLFSENLSNHDFESFVANIFAFLIERTERCLEAVRADLIGATTQQLHAELSELESKVGELGKEPKRLVNHLSSCRASIGANINQICNWFQISKEAALLEGDVELASEIACKMISTPEMRKYTNISRLCQANLVLSSRHFCSFVYMVFQFLDNAIKYGHIEEGAIQISLNVQYREGRIVITTDNSALDSSSGSHARTINDVVAKMRKNPGDRGAGEGGTGLAKVLNILEGEFSRRNYTLISTTAPSLLRVELQFDSFGIISPQ